MYIIWHLKIIAFVTGYLGGCKPTIFGLTYSLAFLARHNEVTLATTDNHSIFKLFEQVLIFEWCDVINC